MDRIIIVVFVSLFILVKVLKYKGIIPTKPRQKRAGVWRFVNHDANSTQKTNLTQEQNPTRTVEKKDELG